MDEIVNHVTKLLRAARKTPPSGRTQRDIALMEGFSFFQKNNSTADIVGTMHRFVQHFFASPCGRWVHYNNELSNMMNVPRPPSSSTNMANLYGQKSK